MVQNITQRAQIGPACPNWTCMVKIRSSGIKIVLTCIKHNYMSYWTPRRSFRHPWGPQNGPKHHPKGPNWSCMTRIDPAWSSVIEKVLTCIVHDYMLYWPTLGSYRHPWGAQNGHFLATSAYSRGVFGQEWVLGWKYHIQWKWYFLMVVWDFSLHSWVKLN